MWKQVQIEIHFQALKVNNSPQTRGCYSQTERRQHTHSAGWRQERHGIRASLPASRLVLSAPGSERGSAGFDSTWLPLPSLIVEAIQANTYLCLDNPTSPTNQISTAPAHMAKKPSAPLSFIHSEGVCRKPKQKWAFWLAKTIWHVSQILKVSLSEIWASKIWGVEF